MILKRFSKRTDVKAFTVDTKYTGDVSPFSRNSHAAIQTPRLFCYALNSDTETIVTKDRTQYLISVPDSKIVEIDLATNLQFDAIREQIQNIADNENLAGYSYTVHGLEIVCLTRGTYETQKVN